MTTVYIVEETTWDHHDNIAVFLAEQLAINFCNSKYRKHPDGDGWTDNRGYHYYINQYEVLES